MRIRCTWDLVVRKLDMLLAEGERNLLLTYALELKREFLVILALRGFSPF